VLTVIIDNLSESVVLRCHGRIVRGEESTLLCAAVKHHGRDVVLDLGGVSAIDAAGIGALVSLQAAGVYLKLVNPTEPVREVLRLTGLEKVFEISEGQVAELLGEAESLSPDAEFYVRESKILPLRQDRPTG
jgi:anti-anti-sigma factor